MDLPQEAFELQLAGKAFPRPRNFGIQDQRTRTEAASLVAFAERMTATQGSSGDQKQFGMKNFIWTRRDRRLLFSPAVASPPRWFSLHLCRCRAHVLVREPPQNLADAPHSYAIAP